MKRSDLIALQQEPACSHSKLAEKSGCSRPVPGATAGGCAFDGAQIALLPIADVAHIIHGPIACAGNTWDNRGSRSSGALLYKHGLTTDLSEQDVIMGRGEKRLLHGIRQAIDSFAPAAVFVYNTCVPALEGDDIEAVCRTAQELWGTPVVAVDCAGFYGSKNFGNRIAGEAMVKQVIGTREPPPKPLTPSGKPVRDIALVGEFNIAGEFWHVAPLFDQLGLRLLCCLAGDARFAEVQMMHRAEALMVVCSKAMVNVARQLQQRYQLPWFEGSFYGITDTSSALRDFARLLDDTELSAATGATLAVMGVDSAIPLLHGSQGCAAFAKVFFVQHFREPLPIQTTASDVERIKSYISAFGLNAIILPDISLTLDGHLGDAHFNPTATGGCHRLEIAEMGASQATIVIGQSLAASGQWLGEHYAMPVYQFDHLGGLTATDRFIQLLATLSGRPVPATIDRARRRYQDALLDAHFLLSQRPVALAGEGDELALWYGVLAEVGCPLNAALAPVASPALAALPAGARIAADLGLLEAHLKQQPAALLVGNSHTAASVLMA